MANGNFNDLPIPYTTDIPTSAIKVSSSTDLQSYLANASATFTVTIGAATQTVTVYRKNRMVEFAIGVGATTGTPFSGVTSSTVIGTLPTGFRPAYFGSALGFVRSSPVWASATYTPVWLTIDTSGELKIQGNNTAIQSAMYLVAGFHFMAAG